MGSPITALGVQDSGKAGSCSVGPGRVLPSYNSSFCPREKLPAQTISSSSTPTLQQEQKHTVQLGLGRGWDPVSFEIIAFSERSGEPPLVPSQRFTDHRLATRDIAAP